VRIKRREWLDFLERCYKAGDEFLSHIVTDDETRVSFVNVETKEQSKKWITTHSPNRRCLSARKLMETIFWDRKGVLMVEFMQQGTTITSEVYCMRKTEKLHRTIKNKRLGMLTSCVMLLRDNARPHTTACTRALPERFSWELFDHPSYIRDLVPNDYHLFAYLKNW
jgi:hypothetical protein